MKAGGSAGISWGEGQLFRQFDPGAFTSPHSGILTVMPVTSTADGGTAFISAFSGGYVSPSTWGATEITPGTSRGSFGGPLTLLVHSFQGLPGVPWYKREPQDFRGMGPGGLLAGGSGGAEI